MKNIIILERECFRGSVAKNFRTSPAMAKLLEDPKVASVLLDDRRRREFFETMWGIVGENGKLDTETLRKILGDLYVGAKTISKGGIERIADALLTENRDPKYFTYPEESEPEDPSGNIEKVSNFGNIGSVVPDDPEKPPKAKKRLIDRVLGR